MIQKNWTEMIKPSKLNVEGGGDPKRKASIVAEPLERGFGLTLHLSREVFIRDSSTLHEPSLCWFP